jgi:hypothetical protein
MSIEKIPLQLVAQPGGIKILSWVNLPVFADAAPIEPTETFKDFISTLVGFLAILLIPAPLGNLIPFSTPQWFPRSWMS